MCFWVIGVSSFTTGHRIVAVGHRIVAVGHRIVAVGHRLEVRESTVARSLDPG